MDIFIQGSDDFLMKLPVNPSEIVVNENQKLEVIEVLDAGEVPQIGFPQLQTLTIESFFPSKKDGNYIKKGMDAIGYFNKLRKWKSDREPVRVVISDLFGQAMKGGNVNQLFYVTDFQYSAIFGYESDIPYRMKLVQYKKLEPRKIVIEKKPEEEKPVVKPPTKPKEEVEIRPPTPQPTPKPETKPPRYHTVVYGEYLRLISRKYYGDEMKWSTIYNANKDKIKHPDLIYAGQKFLIPYLTTETTKPTPKVRTHKVVSGDTLWALAVKYYGNGNQYMKIVNGNKGKISNPNIIYVGQVLTIP